MVVLCAVAVTGCQCGQAWLSCLSWVEFDDLPLWGSGREARGTEACPATEQRQNLVFTEAAASSGWGHWGTQACPAAQAGARLGVLPPHSGQQWPELKHEVLYFRSFLEANNAKESKFTCLFSLNEK